MKEKTAASEEMLENTPETGSSAKKQKDRKELHDVFFMIAWILGIAAFVFVWLAQNAVNGDGFVSFQPFNIKKPIEIEFLTTSLCSYIAIGLSVFSIGFGLARNFIKKDKKVISYILGVITLVLAVVAFLAGYYAEL